MANKNFIVQHGLEVGGLTISATTGDITTTGNVTVTGGGSINVDAIGVSSIAKNDSSIGINDTGSGSAIVNVVDGTTRSTLNASGLGITGSVTATQFNGSGAGLTDVPGSAITGFAANVTLGTTVVPLGSTAASLAGLTSVSATTFTGSLTGAATSATTAGTVTTAAQPAITSVGTLSGLTVSAPIAGSVTGNAATATTLATPRAINGVNFDGSAAITVTAAAGTLSGSTLAAGVTASSLTSVGTLGSLNVTGTVNAATFDAGNITVTSDTISSAHTTITIDPSTPGAGGLVVINGNLQVTGTTTTIDSTTVSTSELNIQVANGAINAAAANGAGLTVATAGATLTYTSADDRWNFNKNLNVGTVYGATNGTHTGAVVGNASTATTLQTARNINGVSFNGSADVTVTAAAGTLSGSTLAAGVTASSLTSVGTLGSLTVTNAVSLASVTKSGTTGVGDIGQVGNVFGTVYATNFNGVATTAKYADLAENYQADATYPAGTVLAFGGVEEVTVAASDTKAVAGVVSTNPAHLMNGGLNGSRVVALALQGRVPCKVIGPVKKGDLMVSAGFGYAKANNNAQIGQVIGKALQDYAHGKGMIEVVVGRV